MQQLGNIITPKKLTQTDAPKVDVASADTATNVDHNIAKALLEFHKTNPHAFEDKKNPHFKNNYASLESVTQNDMGCKVFLGCHLTMMMERLQTKLVNHLLILL